MKRRMTGEENPETIRRARIPCAEEARTTIDKNLPQSARRKVLAAKRSPQSARRKVLAAEGIIASAPSRFWRLICTLNDSPCPVGKIFPSIKLKRSVVSPRMGVLLLAAS